jgi:hypothetical protein
MARGQEGDEHAQGKVIELSAGEFVCVEGNGDDVLFVGVCERVERTCCFYSLRGVEASGALGELFRGERGELTEPVVERGELFC